MLSFGFIDPATNVNAKRVQYCVLLVTHKPRNMEHMFNLLAGKLTNMSTQQSSSSGRRRSQSLFNIVQQHVQRMGMDVLRCVMPGLTSAYMLLVFNAFHLSAKTGLSSLCQMEGLKLRFMSAH